MSKQQAKSFQQAAEFLEQNQLDSISSGTTPAISDLGQDEGEAALNNSNSERKKARHMLIKTPIN